jgi:hypothetical protein
MATIQSAPAGVSPGRDNDADANYWDGRRRALRSRLFLSGAASWVLHGCILLALVWGGKTLAPKSVEPPRVDVVAAVSSSMGAPGRGDDGIAPSPRGSGLDKPSSDPAAGDSQQFLSESLPPAVLDSLPKDLDVKLPSAELVGSIIGGGGGLIGGSDDAQDPGNGGRGGGGGTGPSGLGSGWSTTEFMQVRGAGTKFVYVIDRSGSMIHHDRIGAVKRELLASLAQLSPEVQFQVIFYNLRPDVMPIGGKTHKLVYATEANKAAASRFLDTIIADGGTEHFPALKTALGMGPDLIYFLTDADDLKERDVREVTELNRGRATIHTIEFAIGPERDAENMLRILAQQNRGTYRYIDVGKLGTVTPSAQKPQLQSR